MSKTTEINISEIVSGISDAALVEMYNTYRLAVLRLDRINTAYPIGQAAYQAAHQKAEGMEIMLRMLGFPDDALEIQ